MKWSENLINRARRTAEKRKRIYGIEPAPVIAALLTREETHLHFRDGFRLLVYRIFTSPLRRLKLFWQNLTDRDTPVRRQQIDQLRKELFSQLSENCRIATTFFERRNLSRDLARVPPMMETLLIRTTPSMVVQPQNEQDIIKILDFCGEKKLALFPRGTSSFAFGGAVPTKNGILMDLSPLMEILEIDSDNHKVRVQPGVRWADLAAKLEPFEMVPQTTPTSRFSTVAGWISTGGMGLNSYAYGGVSEAVLGVRVVRPDGTIEILSQDDESIKDLYGTEGQFGILTEITLRIRPQPKSSLPCLLTFEDPGEAFEFIDNVTQNDVSPSHVVFFDRESMARENILFREHTSSNDGIVPEEDIVLLHFETAEEERRFLSTLNGSLTRVQDNQLAARYLWADRYFPLKAQRIGPGLLGSEVVIPAHNLTKYVLKVRKLARHLSVRPAIEVIACREAGMPFYLVIVSFSCDNSRSVHYVLRLLFIQLLVKMAVRIGGHPYGIGIWNTPFVKSKYGPELLTKLRTRKKEIDPGWKLNPNKFFKVKGRFFSIPAIPLRPNIFNAILTGIHWAAPILGVIARWVEPPASEKWMVPAQEENQGKKLLRECAQRCSLCGSCVSVCPAYHITKDELVTGRAKLRMADTIMLGRAIRGLVAHSHFQCLHCGLCEEVCQTQLPLRECYEVLEQWLEKRFGAADETIQQFIQKLDSRREFIKEVFGLNIPEWSPEAPPSKIPDVTREEIGGEV